MASDLVVSVGDSTFENEVLKSNIPVLVDFWAEWCGPCKMIAPILDDVSSTYLGKLKIAKINIDESPAIPAKYNVRGIPTLILFENGDVKATKVGALSRTQLTAFLDSYI
jgi:thioredoxin 1